MTIPTPTTSLATTIAAPGRDWRYSAACAEVDPELFFPARAENRPLAQVAEAKKVCAGCPVSQQCLDWALETRQDSGVWGGLSENERRLLHRRVRRYDTQDPPMAERIIKDRLAEFEAAMATGESKGQVARALGTNVQTVNTVLALLDERAGLDAASEAVAS
ncbi:WhiB family transcriptional regulator [Streptomyces sp. SP18CM02]|nr:WhiB family transcriptional regulator [Streptomyces sp. SP18CM02]